MSLDEVTRKNSEGLTKKKTGLGDYDDNVFHQQSQKQSIALVFFRFSHRDESQRALTNREQEKIVENIKENIFYLTEHMTPHELSSTKVPFFDPLIDEN